MRSAPYLFTINKLDFIILSSIDGESILILCIPPNRLYFFIRFLLLDLSPWTLIVQRNNPYI